MTETGIFVAENRVLFNCFAYYEARAVFFAAFIYLMSVAAWSSGEVFSPAADILFKQILFRKPICPFRLFIR